MERQLESNSAAARTLAPQANRSSLLDELCGPACEKLWATVLEYGLADAQHQGDTGWLGTRDFRTVCALAGLDPEAVIEAFRAGRFAALKKHLKPEQ
jgi:hypothetical protein